MIKSYKQINLCVALYQESDSGLKLSPGGSLLDFMSSVFGESPTATTANHKTCGHVLGCGLNTVRRLLASPSLLLHLSVSSSSSFLSSVWLGLPQPPFVRSPFTPSQSGRKECFTPGLQSCACQRRVCNPPPLPRFSRPVVFFRHVDTCLLVPLSALSNVTQRRNWSMHWCL